MLNKVFINSFYGNFRYPLDIILHITSKCNSFCQTCFNWKNLHRNDQDLSVSEFEKIAYALKKILWLNISGGEPYLRDDLPYICEIFYKIDKPSWIDISTNGILSEKIYLLTEETLKRIKIPISVAVSLDGLNELHDEIRGSQNNFVNTMRTFNALGELKKKFPNLLIKAITVISNKNFEQLDEIINFARYKIDNITFHSNIFLRGEPRQTDVHLPEIKKLQRKKDLLLGACRNNIKKGDFSRIEWRVMTLVREYLINLNFEILKKKRQIIPCLAGKVHGVISSNGEVSFCELGNSIGNLRDYNFDFNKLWYSKKAEGLRGSIKNKECYCTHECVQLDNIIFNRRMYLPLTMRLFRPSRVSWSMANFIKYAAK